MCSGDADPTSARRGHLAGYGAYGAAHRHPSAEARIRPMTRVATLLLALAVASSCTVPTRPVAVAPASVSGISRPAHAARRVAAPAGSTARSRRSRSASASDRWSWSGCSATTPTRAIRRYAEVIRWVERDGIGGVSMSLGTPVEVAAKLNDLQRRARVPLLVQRRPRARARTARGRSVRALHARRRRRDGVSVEHGDRRDGPRLRCVRRRPRHRARGARRRHSHQLRAGGRRQQQSGESRHQHAIVR